MAFTVSPDISSSKTIITNNFNNTWVFRLILNLLGYATVFIPGYIIFKFVKKTKYFERSGENLTDAKCVFFFFSTTK